MFEYLSEFAIIVSIVMLLFGLYCIYFLQAGGYEPALILPIISLTAGIIGYCRKRNITKLNDNDETDDL